ncbi:bidirectional sugar transporter SWEET3b-like [Cryptomeria japonica]|uniref:bidirectional sugar transporter SWEET3b-like n=1 Tax=Cryptomeria japonica TaxID=3369 RepID=UPI0027DA6300|nr:bidirectional sugar transporter SWEET3b-like [Cryptomeria japonica]
MNKFLRCGAGRIFVLNIGVVVCDTGSAFALLMYGAPLSNFRGVMRKKTTGEMSGLPYAIGLLNCLVYTWYGSPLISNGWDNALVMATNAIGLLLQFCFCGIYLLFAPSKPKRIMGMILGGVLVVFASIASASMWGIGAAHKKVLVGTTGMVASVILYGSPLSDIRTVVKSKSVECMSFYFSMFAFLGSVLWLVYGALSRDILIMAPNFLGIPLASTQMIIYCVYSQKSRARVEDVKSKALTTLSEEIPKGKCTKLSLPQTDIEMQMEQKQTMN